MRFCMDFSWKSAILHAIYAHVSVAMPVACTVLLNDFIHTHLDTISLRLVMSEEMAVFPRKDTLK